ncbi:MAG: TraB/GumN family protein [Hyphomicrobiaceae bacterium]
MRVGLRLIFGLAVLAAASLMPAAGARAAKAHPAVCKGTDLIEQLAKTDPAGYARIVSRASELENSQAIFWLIEKEGHEPSYLLGTVHLTDDRVKRLPVAAELAFAKAKHVAVETFFDSEEDIQHVLESMPAEAVSSTDEHLSAHLRVEEYARLTALAEAAGIDKSELDGLKPWVAEMLVRGPTCEARRVEAGELVLDAWLAGRALRRGLPLRKLETVAEQFETLAAIPYDQQLAMLRYALADKPSRAQDETETLIGLYLRRQIPATDALTRMLAPDGAVANAYLAAYWGDLIDRRNRRFVANAQPLLDQGRVFIAVGAAHLPGENGVVAMLRKAGYRVSAADDGPGPLVVAAIEKPSPQLKPKPKRTVRRKPVKIAIAAAAKHAETVLREPKPPTSQR